ncbi:MAG: toxin-antitoxin system YwqK family antitoxin [Saprospiraceae bacterium]|nr:toxin-antitoxin system YwqK family antitoxin [Saprospiraceae bacterium]
MKPVFLYFFLLLFIACSPHQMVQVKDDQGSIVEEYDIIRKTGKKHGEYRKFSNDRLIETAHYKNDTLDGKRTIFDREGNKEIEEIYVMGVYEGPYLTFYSSGQVKLDGSYQDGTMEGIWKKYYEAGKLMESVTMHDNQENGPFVEYWENGNLKAEGAYLDGDNEDGELRLYDELGELEKTMNCERGICHTTWKKETSTSQ